LTPLKHLTHTHEWYEAGVPIYLTKLRLFDDRRLSINYYVALATLLQKIFSWQGDKIVWWQVWQWSRLVYETCSHLYNI